MAVLRMVARGVSASVALALILGCTGADPDDIGEGDGAAQVNSSSEAPGLSRNISVAVADRAAYDELVESHRGKVVLVDFWATWCPPCVEQFPHTVEMSKRYDANKLAVVAVSMDEPDEKENVLKFLQDRDAMFDNLISKYGVGQAGFEAFEIGDSGIPHYKIYDRAGALRHTGNTNEEIEPLIQQLVNEE